MEVSRVKALRAQWKSKGEPLCAHNNLDAESTEAGYFTGRYVCKACGEYVQVHNDASRPDSPDPKRSQWGRYALFTSMGLLAAAVPVLTVWYNRKRRGEESP